MAFLIEFVGGFFGLLGLGYLYVGRTNDGVLRLIGWLVYNIVAYIVTVSNYSALTLRPPPPGGDSQSPSPTGRGALG